MLLRSLLFSFAVVESFFRASKKRYSCRIPSVDIEHITPDTPGFADPLTGTCPHVIYALITRFLWDDVLQESYDSVMPAQQRERDGEL